MPVKFPIARSAIEVLNAGIMALTRAPRASEASSIAGKPVRFVSEFVGEEFEAEEAALDYYKGLLEDGRITSRHTVELEYRYMTLVCRFRRPPGRPRKRGRSAPSPEACMDRRHG